MVSVADLQRHIRTHSILYLTQTIAFAAFGGLKSDRQAKWTIMVHLYVRDELVVDLVGILCVFVNESAQRLKKQFLHQIARNGSINEIHYKPTVFAPCKR